MSNHDTHLPDYVLLAEAECVECGGRWQPEVDMQGHRGSTPAVPAQCPSCAAIAPYAAPLCICGGRLRGKEHGWECCDCDQVWPLDLVRELLLGRDVARTLSERPTVTDAERAYGLAGASERRSEVLTLILRAARQLGVLS